MCCQPATKWISDYFKEKRFNITFHSFLIKDKQLFNNQGQKDSQKKLPHSPNTPSLKPDNFVDTLPDSKHRSKEKK